MFEPLTGRLPARRHGRCAGDADGNTIGMLIGQLSVRAFGSDAEALGAGLRQRIEFTALNADAKVEQLPAAGDLDGLVGRPGRR